MTLEIPYTFIPGTKAMANQVNENFLAVKSSFDENEDLLEEAQADILRLDSNKADIQGSITTQFDVADATNNYNAVNLQTYKRLSANTIDIIQGYQLSKFDDHTIAIQSGSCYNSDRTKIITSTSGLQATQSNLNPDGKYYVYITNDNDTIEGVISLSNSAPGGYTTYRQIGYFNTDGDGYINDIYGYGIDFDIPTQNSVVISKSFVITEPEETGDPTTLSWYRVYSDGWCEQGGIFEKGYQGGWWYRDSEFNLLKRFNNNCYLVLGNAGRNTNPRNEASWGSVGWVAKNKTTTTFQGEAFRGDTGNISYNRLYWYACGYLAEGEY